MQALSCETIIVMRDFFVCSRYLSRFCTLVASSAEASSSRIRRSAFFNNALNIEIFCFSPPDNVVKSSANSSSLFRLFNTISISLKLFCNISDTKPADYIIMACFMRNPYWLQNIINDFSRQYGKGNEALSFANTHLRAALEKLAQVVSARRTNGRSIRAGGEGEQEGEKQEIFITFGDNDALRDPDALRPLESYEQDGIIQEGIYESMPSLLFEKGQAAFIPGSMLVVFVNRFSRKKDMAVVYLEHAAKTKSDIKLYYALQPERNMPIENPEYARELEELKEQLALYQKGLENASAAEKGNIEIKLREMEKRIENHHFHRWLISEKAISTYRSFASSVRFYDDNPYVLERGSRMLAQLEDVFERYADGNMSLDAFLQEIEGKMRLMYLERQ